MLSDKPLQALSGIRTPDALATALDAIAEKPVQRLGQTLLQLGLISEGDLHAALAVQRTDPWLPLGELLVLQDRIDRQQLDGALNWTLGFPLVDVDHFPAQPEAVDRVSAATAERLDILPLQWQAGQLVVAMADPKRQDAVDELAWATECWIRPVVAEPEALHRQRRRWHGPMRDPSLVPASEVARPADASRGAPGGGSPSGPHGAATAPAIQTVPPEEANHSDDGEVVRAVNGLLERAVARGASDIHLECPGPQEPLTLRLRLDGRMVALGTVSAADRAAWVSRLKILSGMDITERRRPQDGRLQWTASGQKTPLAFRVATIPTQQGVEDVVLRHLRSAAPLPLSALGMQPEPAAAFRAAIEQPHGLVLCAGPTGSGKTTTLHSAMALLNTPERKLWTAEDPIEITQQGLRQVQVNARIGWTFDKALRALLRADPDVIMVGEIRDTETARVAVEASLTGHLVLSTIHTNSAAETVARLVDMGLDPFQFSDVLRAVVGQRLLRRWCPHCLTRRPALPCVVEQWLDEAQLTGDARAMLRARWMKEHAADGVLWEASASGCLACQGTGLLGRIAIHEVMVGSAGLTRLIQGRAAARELDAWAQLHGMRALRLDAMDKVAAGLLPLSEVRACLSR